jgi:Uncharacterized conserved protein (DUF2075)
MPGSIPSALSRTRWRPYDEAQRALNAKTVTAKRHVRRRYEGQPGKRYGIITSSKWHRPIEIARNASFDASRAFDVVPWLTDPPDSARSCCQLLDAAREFDIQGLELDMPIIGWNSDMMWRGDVWAINKENDRAQDFEKLRYNTYRVLLTRGRDGFVIWVPERLKMTYRALIHCGVQELEPPPDSPVPEA